MSRARTFVFFLAVLLPLTVHAQPAFKPVAKIAAPCQEGPFSPDVLNDSTFNVTCGGGLHTFQGNLTPILVDVPVTRVIGDNLPAMENAGMLNPTATVKISAINKLMIPGCVCPSPVNVVTLNGHEIGNLIAGDGNWTVNTYHVPVEWLNFPQNDNPNVAPTASLNHLQIDLDTFNRANRGTQFWNTKVDWAQASVTAIRPILLVHGIISSAATWYPLWYNQLSSAHVPFFAINLPSMGFRDLETNSAFIGATVTTLKKQWGVDKINIVAHSKGGLDSRDYIEANKHQVDRLVQIASPNAGSPVADIIHQATKHIPGLQSLLNKWAPIEVVLTTTYMKEYNREHGHDDSVRYTAIAGVWHPGWFEISLKRLLNFIVGKGDTLVARSSVHALPYTQNFSYETFGNDGATHTKLTSQFFVYSTTAALLGLPKPIIPIIPPIHIGPFDADDEDLPTPKNLRTAGGSLHAGETGIQTMAVDESLPVAFSMVFPSTDDVAMSVVSPSGVVWDKNSTYPAEAGYEVGDYGGQPMITISFDHPEIGLWQIRASANAVNGPAAAPSTSALGMTTHAATAAPQTDYLVQGFILAPSTLLSVALDRDNVHVGESFRVKGTLTRHGLPLTGASVIAEAALPNGTLLPVTMHDDGLAGDQVPGDGVYTADLPANAGGGEYHLLVTAKDDRPAAVAFSRQESVSGAAATSTTHVQAPFSDRAYSNNTGSQGLDVLAVTGTVNVDAPGHYHFLGTLRDSSGSVVASVSRTIDSGAAGTFPLTFDFAGPEIYLSQKNGPYQFGARVAQDLDNVLAVTQDDPNLYTTAAYNWFYFAPPDPESRTDTDVVPTPVIVQYGNSTDVSATLTADGLPLPGRSLRFVEAGANLGTAITNGNGVASIHNVVLPQFAYPGSQAMTVVYDGDLAYNPGSGSAQFSINQGTQLITWNTPADIAPGTVLGPAQLNATVTGSGAAQGGDLTYDPPAGTVLSFGDHQPLTVTAASNAYYPETTRTVYVNIRYATQVTWTNPSDIVYGTPLSSIQLNATASTGGTFTYSPAANAILNAGSGQLLTVAFTPAVGGYSPATRSVVINVLKATPSISWTPPASIGYGTPLSTTQLNAALTTNGPEAPPALTYSPPAGTVLNAGTRTLTATSTATQNYNAVNTNVTITVTKAASTISWSNPAGITYGTALSAALLNATASVAGTFVYTPAIGTVLNAGGSQTLSVIFTPNDPNYDVRSAAVQIDVAKANQTINWSTPASVVYGTPLSSVQLNATVTVGGPSVAGALSYTPPAGTILHAGPQTLGVNAAQTANYNAATGSVGINVQKAVPVVTWAAPIPIVYGTALSATQLNASANVPGTFVYTPPAGTILNAGSSQTLQVVFTPDDAVDYNAASQSTLLTVTKASQTIQWPAPAAIIYGTPLSPAQLNATVSVAGPAPSGALTYTPPAGTQLPAGQGQTLTVVAAATANYNSATASVTISVLKATPVVTWAIPAPIVYGTALSQTQLNATASVAGTFVYTPPVGTLLNAGSSQTLQVVFTPSDAVDYNTASQSTLLTVTKGNQTINWPAPAAIIYGTPLSPAQLNATVSVAGPAPSGALTYTPPAGTQLPAGQGQTLTVVAAATANYNSATASVTITVLKATPVVTWATPAPIVYGTALSQTQLNATASVSGTFVYTPALGTLLNAGSSQTLQVVFTPSDAVNYNTASQSTLLTVTKASQTIHWSNPADIVHGTSLSPVQLNATVSVVGPASAGVLAYAPPAGTVLPTGLGQTLTVVAAQTTNYNSASATVLLNVRSGDDDDDHQKTRPVLTWANPNGIVYGAALSGFQLNATANVPGSFVYTPPAGTILNAGGAQTLLVTFTPADTQTYQSGTATATIDVAKAHPALSWPAPAAIGYGTPLSSTQLNATVTVAGPAAAGTLVYTPPAGTVLDPGGQMLLVTAQETANYVSATKTVTIEVDLVDLLDGEPEVAARDAVVRFLAPLRVSSSTATGTVTVTLASLVVELARVDNPGGDIRMATLTFVNRATGGTLCSAPVGLVSPSDLINGVATCTFTASTGTYTIGSRVEGSYYHDAAADDVVLSVTAATDAWVGGTDHAQLMTSAGIYAADVNSRADLTLNPQYLIPSGKVGGSVALTFRHTVNGSVHSYQINSSAIDSMAVVHSAGGGIAYLTGPAALTDITSPGSPVVIDNNATLLATFTDNGVSPGNDALAFTLLEKSGGLWFSSKWDGVRTLDQATDLVAIAVHF
jgi:hypothetical protein